MRQPPAMLVAAIRGLIAHAFPILVAQLASIGMMVIDTAVLGHVSPLDLAAVAIGSGIHVSVVFALTGVLEAVAPVVAQLHGARRDGEVAGVLQQGFWLALLLAVPGMLLLTHPGAVLGLVDMDAAVAGKIRNYPWLLAWGLPAALCYRTFYAFCNALGKSRVLMGIGLAALGLHAALSSLAGLLLWLAAAPLIAAYTDDPAVRQVALGLIVYVAIYQFFDALQTIAGHVLRACRVTFLPMLVQTVCFGGVGLLGGGWLCYRWSPPLGAAGFWLAAVGGLVLAAGMLLPLMLRAIQAVESTS